MPSRRWPAPFACGASTHETGPVPNFGTSGRRFHQPDRRFVIRPLTVIVLVAAVLPWDAQAQATHAERLGALAVACVVGPTAGADTVSVSGPERLPFVRSAIVAAWQASGVTVYDADGPGHAVRLEVLDAGVRYARADQGLIERTVRLELLVRIAAADGLVLVDETCSRSESDLVERDALESLENPTWPETMAEAPPRGFLRRILQPVVITAATAAGVFLFFSLRSRRANDGG